MRVLFTTFSEPLQVFVNNLHVQICMHASRVSFLCLPRYSRLHPRSYPGPSKPEEESCGIDGRAELVGAATCSVYKWCVRVGGGGAWCRWFGVGRSS